MTTNLAVSAIETKIFTLRGVQVMIDRDLAELYGVETRRLNEQVKRNSERFPKEFMFQMTKEELEDWKSQFATSNRETIGLRKLPFVFTEQGVSMLSAVLKSDTAIQTSINIINTFVHMRRFIQNNANIFSRLDTLETKQLQHKLETDAKFDQIFDAIESKTLTPKQHLFYYGQIFDAHLFVSDLIKSANTSLILIDNYIGRLLRFARSDGLGVIARSVATRQSSLVIASLPPVITSLPPVITSLPPVITSLPPVIASAAKQSTCFTCKPQSEAA
jgi:hypothetical protein